MDPKQTRARSAAVEPQVRVSAVVVVRAAGAPLELCLRAALAEPWIDELVIVDNGAPPPVASALRALAADRRDIVLVQGQGDVGHAAGANLGAARAHGRWLMFIDSHVVLQRGAAERMAAAGAEANAPWIVGARLVDTSGHERASARAGRLTAWSALAVACGIGAHRPKRTRRADAEQDGAIKVAAISGALMLMPRADFDRLGGFDEVFAAGVADLDLCRRASEAGGRVLMQTAAAGVHFAPGAVDARQDSSALAAYVRRSAHSAPERAFAAIARPSLAALVLLRRSLRFIFGAGAR